MTSRQSGCIVTTRQQHSHINLRTGSNIWSQAPEWLDFVFKTLITICFPFKNEWLSSNIKLTLHKALITSVSTYACPAWEYETEIHGMKLQCSQNRVFHTTGKLPRCTTIHVCVCVSGTCYISWLPITVWPPLTMFWQQCATLIRISKPTTYYQQLGTGHVLYTCAGLSEQMSASSNFKF
jgi:hypothetical protein